MIWQTSIFFPVLFLLLSNIQANNIFFESQFLKGGRIVFMIQLISH